MPAQMGKPFIPWLLIIVCWWRIRGALGLTCPDCGNMEVPYPLSTSSSCGDPQYKVTCDTADKKLYFDALSGSYPITSIQGELQRMVISPPPLLAGQCKSSDFTNQGLVLNQSQPFNITNTNTIFLFNCSQLLLRSPLNCSSSSLCSQYLNERGGRAGEAPVCIGLLCCTFKAGGSTSTFNIRVREDGCSAYTSVLSSKWDKGIEIEWTLPTEPLCNGNSKETSTTCGENSACQLRRQAEDGTVASQWRCLCKPGYKWDAKVGLCLKDDSHCNQDGKSIICKRDTTHDKKTMLETSIAVALSMFVLLSGIAALVMCRRNLRARRFEQKVAKERQEMLSTSSGGKAARLYTAKQMRRATLGFAKDRVIGFGGFGEVYRGLLDDGTEVAVKVAKVGNIKSTEQLLNEVRILSQVNHRNLVRLLGCCVETAQPLLVYEYIPNGTLAEHLRELGRPFLEWPARLSIALQTAEGLAYLHSSAYPPIFHRDVKCSNILLDHQLLSRVCDFGLSRLAEPDATHISTCAQGTLGYLDPEYFRKLQLTDKSDVYSFGVVLFELATSKKAIDLSRGQDDVNLAVLVAERAEAGCLMELADRRLFHVRTGQPLMYNNSDSADVEASVEAVLRLGLKCTHESRAHRPTMREVVEELRALIAAPLISRRQQGS
ncbi:hypothetical protein GOP47_0007194 [Adiantum capillus-veneris]|uniref:Protein kinase domain-containing protein n=1 Tax=Adiantum capillus-veneris TaxID=13818 RepID=A0A9D4V081_ADICA|nr:hypothetical protein GOP47_0007194 [Adiantum capillus-veneris]